VQKGEVVACLSISADGYAALALHPGVRPLYWPAMTSLGIRDLEASFPAPPDLTSLGALGESFARPAPLTDVRLDLSLEQSLFQRRGVVAAIGPHLIRVDASRSERIDEREEMTPLALVTCGEPDRKR